MGSSLSVLAAPLTATVNTVTSMPSNVGAVLGGGNVFNNFTNNVAKNAPLLGQTGLTQTVLGKAQGVVKSISDNPIISGVGKGLLGGASLVYTGGAASGGAKKALQQIGGGFGSAVDTATGAADRRAQARDLANQQNQAQQAQLGQLKQQTADAQTLADATAAQTQARARAGYGTGRRSTILTSPLGLQGNQLGGVKGYNTLLGGGS